MYCASAEEDKTSTWYLDESKFWNEESLKIAIYFLTVSLIQDRFLFETAKLGGETRIQKKLDFILNVCEDVLFDES